jgi:hypothetical protein
MVTAAATPLHDAGRSEVDDWRTAIHEASHCVVGRALGQNVAGCTIVPGDGYGGLTWGPAFDPSMRSNDTDVPDLCEAIGELMPGAGEPCVNAAEIFAHAHVRVVDLMSGTAGESLLHPECTPWVAHSDIRQARALAGLICSSEESITAYLEFGAEEARALILRHRGAVLAIAEALLIHRTLDAAMIDAIISRAPDARAGLIGPRLRRTRLALGRARKAEALFGMPSWLLVSGTKRTWPDRAGWSQFDPIETLAWHTGGRLTASGYANLSVLREGARVAGYLSCPPVYPSSSVARTIHRRLVRVRAISLPQMA